MNDPTPPTGPQATSLDERVKLDRTAAPQQHITLGQAHYYTETPELGAQR